MVADFFPEIEVVTGPLPARLGGDAVNGVLWQIADGQLLLEVPEVARFLVAGGRRMTVDPVAAAPEVRIQRVLRMLPLAALAYQRGMLAFHGAVVSRDGAAVLLGGNSGTGKSTLLVELLRRGWRMLADDLALLGAGPDGQPHVYPVRTGIALWPDALNRLALAAAALDRCDANRFEYLPPDGFDDVPRPLRAVYRLSVHSKGTVDCERISGKKCFQVAGAMLYNSYVADALCDRVQYLQSMATLVQQIPFRELRRPRDRWSLEALADEIDQTAAVHA